jgi:hydroxylamine reductase
VAVFLTLLSLGIKNIAVGPNPPAFFTPNVLKVLVDTYGVKVAAGDGTADALASVR